jgi:hypothetical protein
MILNRVPQSLVKLPPTISSKWSETLQDWFQIILSDRFEPVFRLQHQMLDSMIGIENEIRETEHLRKELKAAIASIKTAGDVARVREQQARITEMEERVSGLRYLRECILFIGDTIATRLLHVDAIKHMAGFQSPGFISGKEGLEAERAAAAKFYREGWTVLFNDLTHSLRIGDLTLRKGDKVRTFEVKTSAEAYATEEAFRQIATPIVIHDYIENDRTRLPLIVKENTDISRPESLAAGAARVNSGIDEEWHFGVPGELYRALRKSRVVSLEKGAKRYLAARSAHKSLLLDALSELTAEDDWIAGNLQHRVVEYGDIPPFSRWFKPESTVEVVTGDLIVVSAVNLRELADLFAGKQIAITWERRRDDLLPIHFTSKFEADAQYDMQRVNICDWHRLRMLYAFLAAETFVDICAFMLSPAALKALTDVIGPSKGSSSASSEDSKTASDQEA